MSRCYVVCTLFVYLYNSTVQYDQSHWRMNASILNVQVIDIKARFKMQCVCSFNDVGTYQPGVAVGLNSSRDCVSKKQKETKKRAKYVFGATPDTHIERIWPTYTYVYYRTTFEIKKKIPRELVHARSVNSALFDDRQLLLLATP